ncbi:MAG TPA: ATP-binding cassette domain-containing protein [Cyclobacteriaceae bacterium]|nr:ATP-binding cassette domain-containing protein [Cyclobacteriaceae bacterium]
MYEVELVNISHSYGNHAALRDISVGFQKEKTTVILGRSGSGKSTLLKTINGLIKPRSGKVIAPDRKQIGYVVQGNGLFPHLTVSKNISMPATIAGEKDRSKISARTNELLQLTGLPHTYIDKYPSELSGGEQQRVALCRALYSNPPVLLMDEPFGALDPITRRGINEKIMELRKMSGITMIIVTHDVAEAKRLADDLLVLDNGIVQQFDNKEKVFQTPANKVVAELLLI